VIWIDIYICIIRTTYLRSKITPYIATEAIIWMMIHEWTKNLKLPVSQLRPISRINLTNAIRLIFLYGLLHKLIKVAGKRALCTKIQVRNFYTQFAKKLPYFEIWKCCRNKLISAISSSLKKISPNINSC